MSSIFLYLSLNFKNYAVSICCARSEPSQTSKINLFARMVNVFKITLLFLPSIWLQLWPMSTSQHNGVAKTWQKRINFGLNWSEIEVAMTFFQEDLLKTSYGAQDLLKISYDVLNTFFLVKAKEHLDTIWSFYLHMFWTT